MPIDQLTDGDRIAQAIFAATAALGQPDAFLARELAEGVVHFLDRSANDLRPSELRDAITTVIRALGQPRIADRLVLGVEEHPVAASERTGCPEAPLAEQVFPSNLWAAQEAGLIHIGDPDHVNLLVGGVIEPAGEWVAGIDWVRRILEARERFSRFVVLERLGRHIGDRECPDWLGEVVAGLRAAGLVAVCHLNDAPENVAGPLFAPRQPTLWGDDESDLPWRFLAALRLIRRAPVRIFWHDDGDEDRLADALRLAFGLGGLTMLPSSAGGRPWRAIGLPSGHPAVSQTVSVSLAALREYVSPDATGATFLEKCRCLIRLGLAVGHAKRSHLRRLDAPALREGFLIERSVLAVGVEDPFDSAPPTAPSARELHAALREVASSDPGGMSCSLVFPEQTIDWPPEADPRESAAHSRGWVGSGRCAIRVRGDSPDWSKLAAFARKLANTSRADAIRFVFTDGGT